MVDATTNTIRICFRKAGFDARYIADRLNTELIMLQDLINALDGEAKVENYNKLDHGIISTTFAESKDFIHYILFELQINVWAQYEQDEHNDIDNMK